MKKLHIFLVVMFILAFAVSACEPTYWKNASKLCKARGNFGLDSHGACVSWVNTESTYNQISHVCQDYDAVGTAVGETFENNGQCVNYLKGLAD